MPGRHITDQQVRLYMNNYHRTLAHRVLTAGFELRLIASVALARTREALHNGWDKNDPKDAQEVADARVWWPMAGVIVKQMGGG